MNPINQKEVFENLNINPSNIPTEEVTRLITEAYEKSVAHHRFVTEKAIDIYANMMDSINYQLENKELEKEEREYLHRKLEEWGDKIENETNNFRKIEERRSKDLHVTLKVIAAGIGAGLGATASIYFMKN